MDEVSSILRTFLCPRCRTALPDGRREFPWCECGWNLPADPVDEMRGLRRLWGRLNRWLGRLHARRDAAWMRHKAPQRRLGWHLLTGLIVLLGGIIGLTPHAIFAGVVVLAVWAWRFNVCLGLGLILLAAVFAYRWNPLGLSWLPGRRPPPELFPAQMLLESAREVAFTLGVAPPEAVAFSYLPVVAAGARIRWSLPPRVERYVVVGLPALAVLSVSEFKALIGHAVVCADGLRAWFYRYIQQALHWFAGVVPWASALLGVVAVIPIVTALSPFLCVLPALLIAGQMGEGWPLVVKWIGRALSVLEVLRIPAIAVGTVWLFLAVLVWLVALWYRRQTLIADRAVSRAYGGNVFLRALPTLWAAQRTFRVQWPSIVREGRQEPRKANVYTQFRDIWAGYPDAYKEKALGEMKVAFRSALYFEPIYEDREALLAGLPKRVSDDQPASVLLPNIAELGARMAE